MSTTLSIHGNNNWLCCGSFVQERQNRALLFGRDSAGSGGNLINLNWCHLPNRNVPLRVEIHRKPPEHKRSRSAHRSSQVGDAETDKTGESTRIRSWMNLLVRKELTHLANPSWSTLPHREWCHNIYRWERRDCLIHQSRERREDSKMKQRASSNRFDQFTSSNLSLVDSFTLWNTFASSKYSQNGLPRPSCNTVRPVSHPRARAVPLVRVWYSSCVPVCYPCAPSAICINWSLH